MKRFLATVAGVFLGMLLGTMTLGFMSSNVTIHNANGVVTTYNNIPTVGNGIPVEYAAVDLVAQSSPITASSLYVVPATGAGLYKVCFVSKVTTIATVSSVLGGAGGFQILYSDADDSVSMTSPLAALFNSTGAALALNTTQGQYNGCMMLNVKASSTIQYQMGYTSVGVTPMQYSLHIILEAN